MVLRSAAIFTIGIMSDIRLSIIMLHIDVFCISNRTTNIHRRSAIPSTNTMVFSLFSGLHILECLLSTQTNPFDRRIDGFKCGNRFTIDLFCNRLARSRLIFKVSTTVTDLQVGDLRTCCVLFGRDNSIFVHRDSGELPHRRVDCQ